MSTRILLAIFLSLSTAYPVAIPGEDKKMGAKADHYLDGTHSHEETHDQGDEIFFSNNEIVMGDIDISASVSGGNISIGHKLNIKINVNGLTHDHEHLNHARHGHDHHIHGMSQEDILILNVMINKIDENLKAIKELTAELQYITDSLNAISRDRKKREAEPEEQSSDETKLLELVDQVTSLVENCENSYICESNEMIDITKKLTSTCNEMEETGTVSSLFQNSFFEKRIKLDKAISAAEKTQGEEKAKALRALSLVMATKLQFQLKGETGQEKVTISIDGKEEEFGLTTEWQTFSYPRPSDGFFSLYFQNNINGPRHVYIQGHEYQVQNLLPDCTYSKAFGCETETENERCRDLREGFLAWNGKYTYTLNAVKYLGWSNWGNWDHCSKKCGGGKQTRTRTCTNPVPQYGGLSCEHQNIEYDTETRNCNLHHCGCIVEVGVYLGSGNNAPNGHRLVTSGQFECSSKCYSNPDCVAWTMKVSDNLCWLKTVYEGHTVKSDEWISGTKECGIPVYTMSGMECSVQEKVAELGTNLWVDRASEITNIPPELEGTTLLQADEDEGKLGFILHSSQPAVAYVALHKNRDGGLILGDWTLKNDLSVEWDGWAGEDSDIEKKLHKVYSKFMKADEDVFVVRNPEKIRDVLTFASFIKQLQNCRNNTPLTEDCYCKKRQNAPTRQTDNNGHDGEFCSKDHICTKYGYCTNGFP